MTVKELILELQKMPQEARVFHLYDGEPRTTINVVYESKDGRVITADFNMVCYSAHALPKESTDLRQDIIWKTPSKPKEYTDEFAC